MQDTAQVTTQDKQYITVREALKRLEQRGIETSWSWILQLIHVGVVDGKKLPRGRRGGDVYCVPAEWAENYCPRPSGRKGKPRKESQGAPTSLGGWIKQQRERLGMTQAQLAKALGGGVRAVSAWEQEVSTPTGARMQGVLDFFAPEKKT